RPEDIHAVRIAAGEAEVLLGGDAVVAASPDALTRLHPDRSCAVINCAETPTADFTRQPDWQFPLLKMQQALSDASRRCDYLDASALSEALLGNGMAANLLLLGYAWQRGWLPVSLAALEKAITLNGAAVAMNLAALQWGRRAAAFPAEVARLLPDNAAPAPLDLDARIALRERYLADYQDAAYARRYRQLLERVAAAEAGLGPVGQLRSLSAAAALSAFRLLAVKDEYEVARLYSHPDFRAGLEDSFSGDFRVQFHFAPPLLSPERKRRFGPWVMPLLRGLAALRRWRGSVLDPFRFGADRKLDRQLLADFNADLERILPRLTPATLPGAVELLALYQEIRGYGPVKAANAARVSARQAALRAGFDEIDPAGGA
ncbi:MAG: hypothetical protein RIR00_536, partial [Pseudomonadota bacterium]